jgi:hypothetical protein
MEPMNLNALTWRKSSRSGVRENCVEVAAAAGAVAVRDSKDPDGPALVIPRTTFARFIHGLR